MGIHTSQCQSTEPSFSSRQLLEKLELWRTPDTLRLPQHHKALMDQHSSHLHIFWPFSNCIMNSCLWHWVHRASGKNITVFANENQSILSSRSYSGQTRLSPDGLDRMPWRKCVADVWEIDRREGEKNLPVGDKWFWGEGTPRAKAVSQDPEPRPMTTKDMAKSSHFSKHPQTSPLAWNFSWWQFIFSFIKARG